MRVFVKIYRQEGAQSGRRRSLRWANSLCRTCDKRLYDRPSAGEVDLVDTELLLTIAVTNAGVDVVVVQDGSLLGVVVDTLTTRSVNPAVGLQDSGTTTLKAVLTTLVLEATSGAGRPADLDLVLLTLSRPVGIETAALANREEEVVVVAVLSNERSFLSMLAVRLEGNVCDCGRAGLHGWVGHVLAEEVVPERTEGHDELRSVPVKCTINGVVVLSSARLDASCAEIGPSAEVLAGRNTDGRVLDTERGDSVVKVVCVTD